MVAVGVEVITETYYVVRNEDGFLGWRDGAHGNAVLDYIGVHALDINTERWTSRTEAEEAAEDDDNPGTVQRVTVTTENVGLHWVDHQRGCGGPCRHWKLMDGTEFVGTLNTDADGDKWYLSAGLAGTHRAGPFDTVEEAKTAAEAAAKGTWT